MMKLKSVFISFKVIVCLLLLRTFGNIMHDTTHRYSGVTMPQLRRYEKLRIKVNNANLDKIFLKNCQPFNVVSKFLTFNLPHAQATRIYDSYANAFSSPQYKRETKKSINIRRVAETQMVSVRKRNIQGG